MGLFDEFNKAQNVATPIGRFACPKCGSREGSVELAPVDLERKCRCYKCGHTWALAMFEVPKPDPTSAIQKQLRELQELRLNYLESELPSKIIMASKADEILHWEPQPEPHNDLADAIAYMTKMADAATAPTRAGIMDIRKAQQGTAVAIRRDILTRLQDVSDVQIREKQEERSVEITCIYSDPDHYARALSNRRTIEGVVRDFVPVGISILVRIKTNLDSKNEMDRHTPSDEEMFMHRLRSKLEQLK